MTVFGAGLKISVDADRSIHLLKVQLAQDVINTNPSSDTHSKDFQNVYCDDFLYM